jgi:hypothetical protein
MQLPSALISGDSPGAGLGMDRRETSEYIQSDRQEK